MQSDKSHSGTMSTPFGSMLTRICCGHAIVPRITPVRGRMGKIFEARVWACPSCNRIRFSVVR